MKKIIRLILLSLSVLSLWPYTAKAVNCSNSIIQTAINNARDGDTITVDPGSCTWDSNVTIPNTKGLTLQGAGSYSTIINMGGNTLIMNTSSARKPVRVTGFKFVKMNTKNTIEITGNATNWRIDNNIFDDAGQSGSYTIYFLSNNGGTSTFTYGVIDSNQFINRNNSTSIFIEWPVPEDGNVQGDWIWSQPASRGTAQAVYIENNFFSGNAAVSQVVDSRWGAKYVLRYNTIHNPWISTHSGCTNGGRDPIWTEIYKNIFTDGNNNYSGVTIEMRSTSGIVWGNTSSSKLNNFTIGLDHERSYRTDCAGVYGGKCDGSRSFDENTSGLNGYRCFGQPGWGQPQATDMRNYTFQGVFNWGNRDGGSAVNMGLMDYGAGSGSNYQSTHLQEGRDYFNERNITVGRIADRPSTCSVGPPRTVYVSTDENSQGATLYVCATTNVWTKHWEPYDYPHPLRFRGGGGSRIPNPPLIMVIPSGGR